MATKTKYFVTVKTKKIDPETDEANSLNQCDWSVECGQEKEYYAPTFEYVSVYQFGTEAKAKRFAKVAKKHCGAYYTKIESGIPAQTV